MNQVRLGLPTFTAGLSVVLLAVGLAVLAPTSAGAAVAGAGKCNAVSGLSVGTRTVATGSAECMLQSGMRISVTVVLRSGGLEVDSSYRSCVADVAPQTCRGTSVSRAGTFTSGACATTLVHWETEKNVWSNTKSSTGRC